MGVGYTASDYQAALLYNDAQKGGWMCAGGCVPDPRQQSRCLACNDSCYASQDTQAQLHNQLVTTNRACPALLLAVQPPRCCLTV